MWIDAAVSFLRVLGKDSLPLFLQLVGVFVLLATLWTPRKPKLKLGTPLVGFYLDRAEREPVYGPSACLPKITEEIIAKTEGTQERILYGLRPQFGNIGVLEELVGQQTDSPIVPVFDAGQDGDERWSGEVIRAGYHAKIESLIAKDTPTRKFVDVGRPLASDVPTSLHFLFGYDTNKFDTEDTHTSSTTRFCNPNIDAWESIVERIESKCPEPKEQAQCIWAFLMSCKTINVIQLKNPYHESFKKIHIRINQRWRGKTTLVEPVAKREGFEITSNGPMFFQAVLAELPPYSTRYLVVETFGEPIDKKFIEVQSEFLQRIAPSTIRRIAIVAAAVSLLVSIVGAISSLQV